jgi:hypothetical protein
MSRGKCITCKTRDEAPLEGREILPRLNRKPANLRSAWGMILGRGTRDNNEGKKTWATESHDRNEADATGEVGGTHQSLQFLLACGIHHLADNFPCSHLRKPSGKLDWS